MKPPDRHRYETGAKDRKNELPATQRARNGRFRVCGSGTGQRSTADAPRVGTVSGGRAALPSEGCRKGVERSLTFRGLDEAEEVKADLLRRHGGIVRRTVGEVVEEWLAWCVEVRGIKPPIGYLNRDDEAPQSVVFGPVHGERRPQAPTSSRSKQVSTHTGHPRRQRRIISFCAWPISCGLGAASKATAAQIRGRKVQPAGRAATGKPQLRIDEARRFEAVALARASGRCTGARGAADGLPRSAAGEVVARVARDIDDGGRVL